MPAIRHHVHIAASPRQVWRALTTSDGLMSWWVDAAQVETRKGGRIVVEFEDDEGNPIEARGMIQTFRPTSHFEIVWDHMGEFPTRGSRLSFQIARDGDETRVSIVHIGGPALDEDESRVAMTKEWKRDLRALQSLLDSD
jgi:uncharacterized protein YndB with AHSA1/START domain